MGKEEEPVYRYPTQMADMRKGKWRLQELLSKGYTQDQLREEELRLWECVNRQVDTAPEQPFVHPLLPGSELLGSGWEWATYTLPDSEDVIKVPAGIFPEVNTLLYLQNTHHGYELCKKYFGTFARDTRFSRTILQGVPTNVIRQRRFHQLFTQFTPESLSSEHTAQMREFGKQALAMLKSEEWLADLDLKKENGVWMVNNMAIDEGRFQVYDFTAYYDAYRLDPERAKEEIAYHTSAWEELLSELA